MGFFSKILDSLKSGLEKTRQTFVHSVKSILLGHRLNEGLINQLETRLIQADVGVVATRRLVDGIRASGAPTALVATASGPRRRFAGGPGRSKTACVFS